MDIWLRNMNSSYKEKIKGIQQFGDSIQILALGNSHATYGVNPDAFNVYLYNLANVNQSFYFDKRLTLKLLPEMPHLKVVLISIDYHTLYFSSQGEQNNWSYFGNGIKYKDRNYFLENISPFLFGYKPRRSFAFLVKDLLKKAKNLHRKTIDFDVEEGVDIYTPMEKGYTPRNGSSNNFNKYYYINRANAFNFVVENSTEKKEILAELSNFIVYLKQKGIAPVLVSCPTFKDYNQYLNNDVVKQNHNDINSLALQYHIHKIDFSESNLFPQEDFYDADHLNKTGALKFSKMINDSLISWHLIH